ncbi:hypothetical protein [Streptomyces lavendofoliae]|uniref:Uncharacterized protein n=1 Tax=Streptomyces lavendofoliae TaxID=67314 RepID=A0A918I3M1_9ACTN|nr:hypothetical protein [Streptomyces lavendofoliae]GGU61212.1 hypothetical protein GCM10010274_57570 [Streptomyces lavendofoliae]
MKTSRQTRTTQKPSRIRRGRCWIARRRTALIYNALRCAAYATGAGIVGLGFYLLQQQL